MALDIGLIGCGTIGREIATSIDEGQIPNTELVSVFDNNPDTTASFIDELDMNPSRVESLSELTAETSLVIEAAGQSAVREMALGVLESSTDLMIMSVGALADPLLREEVLDTADTVSSQLYVPTGAIAGIDAIKAASLADELKSVSLTTRKPPSGLAGAPYINKNDVDLSTLEVPTVIFEGSAKEAAQAFPSNINVAITLSLAGIGPDETRVTILADPNEKNNVHQIKAVGSAGKIETQVENVPSPTNPKTSYLAALSAIEKLRGIAVSASIGT